MPGGLITTVSSRNAICCRSAVFQAPTNGLAGGSAAGPAQAAGKRAARASATPFDLFRLQQVKRSLLPELAAQGPLDLAAGGFRQRAGPQQRDLIRHDLVLGDNRLANAPNDLVDVDAVAPGALDLLNHDETLRAVPVLRREGRAAVATQRRMRLLDGVLDVLRVVIGAADDHDILDPAGDVQFAALVEEAEIAGAQPAPARARLAGNGRPERGGACLGVHPIAARDIGARDPDLADLPGAEPGQGVGIDDRDPLAGNRAPASDNRLRVVRIVGRRNTTGAQAIAADGSRHRAGTAPAGGNQ